MGAGGVACAVALGSLAAVAHAQERGGSGVRSADITEITPYRLTAIEGYVLGSTWTDTNERSGARDAGSATTLSSLSGKAFVMTHGYVYHPNLLQLDLGAGPVFFRDGYATGGVDGHSRRSEYDLSTRATFLRDKPYRGSVSFDRLNSSQAIGPAQSLLTRFMRQGLDFTLLPPVSPAPIYFDASRARTQGEGGDQIIDEDVRSANLRTEHAWRGLGNSSLVLLAMDNDSRSGSRGLPIQATASRDRRLDLDTVLTFGSDQAETLSHSLSYNAIGFSGNGATITRNTLWRMDLNYRGAPSATLQTRLRHQLERADQSAGDAAPQQVRLSALNAGLTWQAGKDLGVTLDATNSRNRGSTLRSDLLGATGSVNYRRTLGLGEFATTYYVNAARRDQQAGEALVEVVGESLALTGLAWSGLRQSPVVGGSVVVHNATRTQTYVEGVDYTLREIGITTELQRLAGGAIFDGQEVLVDYRYDPGGTYAVVELNQSIDLAWRVGQAFSIYLRYVDASSRLTSGAPTAPLNPSTSVVVGSRVDLPFELLGEQLSAGGAAEWTDRREAISPGSRRFVEAYVESTIPLVARGGLRFGARQQVTAYRLTPEQDVTQRTLSLRAWSRFRGGLEIALDGTATRDSGTPLVERAYRQVSARAIWRIRRLTLTLRYDKTVQTQSRVTQSHSRGLFELRRDF